MENFIQKELKQGLTPYLSTAEGLGANIGMDVETLTLAAGKSLTLLDTQKETAVLVIEGTGAMSAGGAAWQYSRRNQFLDSCYCLHVCAGVQIEITADTDTLCYVQKAVNDQRFNAVFYTPEQVDTVIAGSHGELDGTMRRAIRTVFDYNNAPYSNMVLGEVVNSPGLWSSYPPHHHPQPEVYFYRFDKPQGFGAGFANGMVYQSGQNGLLVIEHGFHSQVVAPGYSMCYIWGIRHLEGDPWLNTRIDDEEHAWMIDPNARASFYQN